MTLSERIDAFVQLGEIIKNLSNEKFESLAWRVENNNSWFTPDHTKLALNGLELFLERAALETWTDQYNIDSKLMTKEIGVLMAGNIPAVGFHDLLAVLITGHKAAVKLSSADTVLIKWLVNELIHIDERFNDLISFEEMLKAKDAYIATGSNNSARYFNYYFGKYPSIIRKNRTSVAVLKGDETAADFVRLGNDIFQYFGLGCRNVSKLFIPNKQILQSMLDAMEGFHILSSNHKYINNYDYNKSIYLINGEDHLDNGFLILKESQDLVSPISVVYFELYEDLATLQNHFNKLKDNIQCVLSSDAWFENSIPFGQAQCPKLDDYADGVDTIQFLLGLK
ncbi:Acyl-CoA reductase (LuxC) [Belliella buryatensis]|uniref:Acyl-CoA reductase (LuxC) n=1 Tax=Belliella buryatensis TaxID=1500549 RepID=A0A239AFZ2_9BACT|nr:acyl-CoA reductase [Belliella buryatensis]SNR94262.1 Acyl-CoA reductase (LuxC) [Belliella buryatensis]